MNDHRRLEQRSLALHRLVAQKLRHNPELLEKARGNLRRWQSNPALEEWQDILDGSFGELLEFLTDNSERAIRLRQSSPFAGILSPQERMAVYESFGARAHHSVTGDAPGA